MDEEFLNVKTVKNKNYKKRKNNIIKNSYKIFNKRKKNYQKINKPTKSNTKFIKCGLYLICLFIILLIFYFKFIKTKHYNTKYNKSKIEINNKSITKSDKLGNFEIDENYPENFEKEVFDKIKPKFSGPLIMYTRNAYERLLFYKWINKKI